MTERYPFTWQMKRFGGRFVTEDTDYLLNSFTPWVKTEVKNSIGSNTKPTKLRNNIIYMDEGAGGCGWGCNVLRMWLIHAYIHCYLWEDVSAPLEEARW